MGQDRSTLLDIAKATDPNGMPARVVEVLNQKSAIVQDAPAYPSNAPMGNKTTIRTALPTVTTGKINKGVTRSKGATKQIVDTIGIIEGRSEVDAKLLITLGDEAFQAERARQDRGFVEAMAQKMANLLLYGDELTDEAAFTGLSARLATLATAITGSQVRSMGSVTGGDGTSMYIVDWGEEGAHLAYPPKGKGAAGLQVFNKGEVSAEDADGAAMQVYLTLYYWLVGLVVRDPRHIARIANIDRSDANAASPSQGLLTNLLIDTMTSMPSPMGMQRVIYTHRDIEAAFWKQARDNASMVTIREWLGQPTPFFQGYPIRTLDQMSGAESTVS
jgi:hypothetical protein